MPDNNQLRQQQYEFAAHLRDPDNNPAPADIEPRRMEIYSNLFFNNVRLLLAGTFPVLFEILGEERWAMLIQDFYRDHHSHSPLFPDLPKEFLQYLAEERATGQQTDTQDDPPFMYELAHYEWVEAGLMLAQEAAHDPALDPSGNPVDNLPALSQVAWLLGYAWPVNQIGLENQPTEPAEHPLYYLVYRNSEDEVIFMQLNATSARLFELLGSDTDLSGRAALEQIAAELQHNDPQAVVATGAKILSEWQERGIILGTR